MAFKFNTKTDRFVIIGSIAALLILLTIFLVRGCSKQHVYYDKPVENEDEIIENYEEPEEEKEEYTDLRPLSLLTGLPTDYKEKLNQRPFAAVITNSSEAWPHSGIAAADIIYEVMVEGVNTRMVAIFQSELPEKIGPIRSIRDYFVDIAFNHDAMLVHHGSSPGGLDRMSALGIERFDGMQLEGSIFWRDQTRPDWFGGTRGLEHSSFTGGEGLLTHMENRGDRATFSDNHDFVFIFDEIPANIESNGSAKYIRVPFSFTYPRIFVFDEEIGAYLVENANSPLLDAENREQVVVANVLIQFTPISVIDNAGRLAVTTVGSGDGLLARDGQYFPVRWEKSSHTAPMRWYFENDEPVVLSAGNTWINIVHTSTNIIFE